MKRLLPFLFLPVLALAAPSTPITRGRLTTDLDAAGHSITNGPMATTNFVLEALAAVTNNLPQGGLSKEDLSSLDVDIDTERAIYAGQNIRTTGGDVEGLNIYARMRDDDSGNVYAGGGVFIGPDRIPAATASDLALYALRTNLPSLSASATVGDLVDALNSIANALRLEEEQ